MASSTRFVTVKVAKPDPTAHFDRPDSDRYEQTPLQAEASLAVAEREYRRAHRELVAA